MIVVVYFDEDEFILEKVTSYMNKNRDKTLGFWYGWVMNPTNKPSCHRMKVEYQEKKLI